MVWHFQGIELLLDALDQSEPDFQYVDAYESSGPVVVGRRVGWRLDSDYIVEVPVERVLFMEGNIWNLPHAAALKELIDTGEAAPFRVPAARLYRIDKSRVSDTQAHYEEGDLEYQWGMDEPWDEDDEGAFFVQLVDGNHRALAAMGAGEPTLFVTVGPNFRADVHEDEWVRVDDDDD